MAKEKNDLDIDDISMDSLDLPDLDDTFSDMDPSSRKPKQRVAGGFLSGVKDSALSRGVRRQIIDGALPKGYSSAYDEIEKAWDIGKDTYRAAEEQIRPVTGQLKSIGRRATGYVEDYLPDSVVSRLKKITEDTGSDKRTLDRVDPDKLQIDESLSQIFSTQAEGEEAREKARMSQQAATQAVEETRHQSRAQLLRNIAQTNQRLVDYQDRVTAAYQKKQIELAYRQLFFLRDTYSLHHAHSKEVLTQLEAISKNTALPDSKKYIGGEYLKTTLESRAISSLADYATGFVGQIRDRLASKASEAGSQFAEAVRMGSDALEQAEDMSDMIDPYEQAGRMGGSIAAGKGLPFLARQLGERIGKIPSVQRMGDRLEHYSQEYPFILRDYVQQAASGRTSAERERQREKEEMEAPREGFAGEFDRIRRRMGEMRDSAESSLADFAVDLFPQYTAEQRYHTDELAQADEAVPFSRKTERAITEVIPGYLSRILEQTTKFNAGSAQRLEFDYAEGEFVDSEKMGKRIRERALSSRDVKTVHERIDKLINQIDPDKELVEQDRDALARQLVDDIRQGRTFNPERYGRSIELGQFADKDSADRVASFIQSRFLDDEGKIRDDDQTQAFRSKAGREVRGLRRDMPNYQEKIRQLSSVYSPEQLRRTGLVHSGEADGEQRIDAEGILARLTGQDEDIAGIDRRAIESKPFPGSQASSAAEQYQTEQIGSEIAELLGQKTESINRRLSEILDQLKTNDPSERLDRANEILKQIRDCVCPSQPPPSGPDTPPPPPENIYEKPEGFLGGTRSSLVLTDIKSSASRAGQRIRSAGTRARNRAGEIDFSQLPEHLKGYGQKALGRGREALGYGQQAYQGARSTGQRSYQFLRDQADGLGELDLSAFTDDLTQRRDQAGGYLRGQSQRLKDRGQELYEDAQSRARDARGYLQGQYDKIDTSRLKESLDDAKSNVVPFRDDLVSRMRDGQGRLQSAAQRGSTAFRDGISSAGEYIRDGSGGFMSMSGSGDELSKRFNESIKPIRAHIKDIRKSIQTRLEPSANVSDIDQSTDPNFADDSEQSSDQLKLFDFLREQFDGIKTHFSDQIESLQHHLALLGTGAPGELSSKGIRGANLLRRVTRGAGKGLSGIVNFYGQTFRGLGRVGLGAGTGAGAALKGVGRGIGRLLGGSDRSAASAKDVVDGEGRARDVYKVGYRQPILYGALLDQGEYFSQQTGEPIHSLDEIDGPIVDRDGNVIITAEDIQADNLYTSQGESVKSKFSLGSIVRGYGKFATLPYKGVWGIGKKVFGMAKDLVERPRDIYVVGESRPRLLATVMQNGGYRSKKTGKPIMSVKDIDSDVVDFEGNTVLSLEDMARGVVDSAGRKIRSLRDLGIDLLKGAGSLYVNYLKAVGKGAMAATKAAGRGIGRLTGLRQDTGEQADLGPQAPDDEKAPSLSSRSDELLEKIYEDHGRKLKEISETLKAKKDPSAQGFDRYRYTNEGKRVGGWRDQFADSDTPEADVDAEGGPSATDDREFEEERWRKEDSLIPSMGEMFSFFKEKMGPFLKGIVGSLAGMLGIKKLLRRIPGMGGSMPDGGDGDRRDRRNQRGRGGGGSSRSGGGSRLGRLARGAGRVAMAGAAAVGKFLVGAAKVVGAVIASPIVLKGLAVAGVAAAVAGVAYGGYRLYQHLSSDKLTAIDRFRLAQYGVTKDQKQAAAKVLELEKLFRGKIKFDEDAGEVEVDGDIDEDKIDDILEIEDDDKAQKEALEIWLEERFFPTLAMHSELGREMADTSDPSEVFDALEPRERVAYVKRSHFGIDDEDSPYFVTDSPFSTLDTLLGPKKVHNVYQNVIEELEEKLDDDESDQEGSDTKEKDRDEDKDSKDPDKPSIDQPDQDRDDPVEKSDRKKSRSPRGGKYKKPSQEKKIDISNIDEDKLVEKILSLNDDYDQSEARTIARHILSDNEPRRSERVRGIVKRYRKKNDQTGEIELDSFQTGVEKTLAHSFDKPSQELTKATKGLSGFVSKDLEKATEPVTQAGSELEQAGKTLDSAGQQIQTEFQKQEQERRSRAGELQQQERSVEMSGKLSQAIDVLRRQYEVQSSMDSRLSEISEHLKRREKERREERYRKQWESESGEASKKDPDQSARSPGEKPAGSPTPESPVDLTRR